MNYYVYGLIALHFIVIGIQVGKEDHKELMASSFALAVYLPLFGRILGWW
jgi:hypothetical protein